MLEASPPKLDAVPDVGAITLACALGYGDLRFEGKWRAAHPKLVKWLDEFAAKVPAFEKTRVTAWESLLFFFWGGGGFAVRVPALAVSISRPPGLSIELVGDAGTNELGGEARGKRTPRRWSPGPVTTAAGRWVHWTLPQARRPAPRCCRTRTPYRSRDAGIRRECSSCGSVHIRDRLPTTHPDAGLIDRGVDGSHNCGRGLGDLFIRHRKAAGRIGQETVTEDDAEPRPEGEQPVGAEARRGRERERRRAEQRPRKRAGTGRSPLEAPRSRK